ncbi:MAG: hypothetical protein GY842_24880 [bacterium]|nr:hypothetical protein [bacterium]
MTVQFSDGTTSSELFFSAEYVDIEHLLLLGGDAVLFLGHGPIDGVDCESGALKFCSLMASGGVSLWTSSFGPHLVRPVVRSSVDGDGAFLVYYEKQEIGSLISAAVYREDTGAELWSPVGVALHYPANSPIDAMAVNGTPAWLVYCSAPGFPRGTPSVTFYLRYLVLSESPVVFPDTPVSPGSSSTKTVEIINTGRDCTTVTGIEDVPPFHYVSGLPAGGAHLAADGGSIEVTLKFTPTSVDHFSEDLPIVGLMSSGATAIPCTGDGIPSVADDFYVRDWTDNSELHDRGAEPSTRSVFYTTSDVWNRRAPAHGTFTDDDQPVSEDAGAGIDEDGRNWAFARIHRNLGTGTGSHTVTAEFLFALFGAGSNFALADAGGHITSPHSDPIVVAFDPGDARERQTTPFYEWRLDVTGSGKLCLAVEIWSDDDPVKSPRLAGRAPGGGEARGDVLVIEDNNKAQRNVGVFAVAGGAGGAGESAAYYAVAHNGATVRRDMMLLYEASPEVARRLRGASVGVVGGRSRQFKSGDTLVLKNMQPGENRWVRFTFKSPQGKEGEILPVEFFEMASGAAVNGFSIAPLLSSPARVIHDRLQSHRSVFTRMVAGFDVREAKDTAAASKDVLKEDDISEQGYLTFLRLQLPTIDACCRVILKRGGVEDVFDVESSLKRLTDLVQSGEFESASVAHGSLLNKLDSFLTMLQLSNGDPADILQMVRWQRALYTKLAPLRKLSGAESVVKESDQFIAAYGTRKVTNKEYPALMRRLMSSFNETGESADLKRLRLQKEIAEMKNSLGDLTALQKAHRTFLLKLYKLDK